MEKAAAAGACLLHASEACLSGFTSFTDFDWERHAGILPAFVRWRQPWIYGSYWAWYTFSAPGSKPASCFYLINPQGAIFNRYDKGMCTGRDQ